MANVLVEETSLQSIADAIREKNGTEDTYKPSQMPQAIRDIPSGGGDDFQSQFWDIYQQNGERTDYEYLFATAWTDEIFCPKYDIVPKNANMLFDGSQITNLSQRLKDCGVVLDLSKALNATFVFRNSTITVIPPVSFVGTGHTALSYVFHACYSLVTIEKMTVQARHTYDYTFGACTNLENITIEGEIGNDIRLANSSKLTTASVDSIINALVDLTGGTAQKISLHTTVLGILTDEQLTTIKNKNWTVG